MPELPVKEGRMSELHLPEISRNDIMRSLSEIRMPEVDLSKVDLPDVDLGKAVAGAAAAANIGRGSRPRWPFAVGGLIVAGVATAAILSNETIRAKIAGGFDALRERVQRMRSTDDDEPRHRSRRSRRFRCRRRRRRSATVTPLQRGLGARRDRRLSGGPRLERPRRRHPRLRGEPTCRS